MQRIRVICASCAILIAPLLLPAYAGQLPLPEPGAANFTSNRELTDLLLGNFFTAGWDEPFTKRPRAGAPDLSLLRVQTNFLVRTLRTDYAFERPLRSDSERNVQTLNQLVEWSFNRRFMLAVFGSYKWIDNRAGEDESGGAWGAIARLQLVDTPHSSYALNCRVAAPNDGLNERQTTLSFALAGWHDLAPLGLGRTGFYWHVQEETYLGPHAPGARLNDLTYAGSLATTWTSPEAPFGNFSTFVEAYAKTDLDGPRPGRSVVTITPGLRFTVAHRHIFMAGLEVPASEPRSYERMFRFSYLYTF